jgi:hypothetical protein
MFVAPQPQQQPQPRYVQPAQPPRQQARATGNQRYLPAMPEMLTPRNNPKPAQPQLAANDQPRVVIRGQSGSEPAQPAKLTIPTPEELGLLQPTPPPPAPASSAEVDWTAARDRLEKYGAVHYRLERVEDGWRFVCALPHPEKPNAQHQFEVRAASDREAMATLLQRVEEWRSQPAAATN